MSSKLVTQEVLRSGRRYPPGERLSRHVQLSNWQYVLAEIEQVLAGAGCVGNVGVFGTHHNPVRLSGDLIRGAETIDHHDRLLDDLRVTLYTLDLSLLSSSPFWDEL